ncbi:hypothetical protein T265_13856, partial [Opisthorchis viverrini]
VQNANQEVASLSFSGVSRDAHSSPSEEAEAVLKCLYTNCLSLFNKLGDVKQSACLEKLSIIALTETWLTPDVSDAEISIDGERQPLTDKNKTDPGNLGESLDPVYQSVNP